MADQIIMFAVQEILKKVASLAAEQISLAWGLKGDLKKLEQSLTLIQSVLDDAEKRQVTDEAVKKWLKRLKDAVYKADDALDEYAYEILRRKVEMKRKVRFLFSSHHRVAFRIKLANRVKQINVLLDDIEKEANKFGLQKRFANMSPLVFETRETHSFLGDINVVGREDDKFKIVEMLTSPNDLVLSVVSIVGMAGVGKTALAQLVYNDDYVKNHFDERIWVCISENFDSKRVLFEIFESLNNTKCGIQNLDTILQSLKKRLKGKRFLLTLDDVWNEDQDKWNELRNCLLSIGGSLGNCILVTTRSDQVASNMKAKFVHHLSILSEDDCWSIFQQIAFTDGGPQMTQDLEGVGRLIVGKCAGVPLAVRVLGGLMYSKKDISEWVSIQNSEIWDLPEDKNGILPVLKLSFNHLPSPSLKECFSYCSMLPKDAKIDKYDLVQLWMAQGFLQPSPGSNLEMEDLGNEYFNVLVSNCLFQDIEKDEYGNIKNCMMHDLVHNLAIYVAKDDCLNLKDGQVGDISGIQHLSLSSKEDIRPNVLNDGDQNLRSLFSVSVGDFVGALLIRLKCLRVLCLRGSGVRQIPSAIKKLKHLRYFDVSNTKIKTLPESIAKLYNLQTLRLLNCFYLEKLPKDINKLVSLRHLYVDDNEQMRQCMPIGLGDLNGLQTLSFFVVGKAKGLQIEELGCLSHLRGDLKIYGLENLRSKEDAQKANLSKNASIHQLKFHWNCQREEMTVNDEEVLEGLEPSLNLKSLTIENFEGTAFPSWMTAMKNHESLLQNMVQIKLVNCNKCQQIPTLGHLPYLQVIEIEGMHNLKGIGNEFYHQYHVDAGKDSSSGVSGAKKVVFPALKKLVLKDMRSLVEWAEGKLIPSTDVVFPVLEDLEIAACPELIIVPSHFPSIKGMRIEEVNSQALLKLSSETTTLTSLQIKSIFGSNLNLVLEEFLEHNRFLKELTIDFCEELHQFPNGLQNLASLETLQIQLCQNLDSIPDEIGSLKSLRRLTIAGSNRLTWLPDEIQSLTSLEYFSIMECPNLILIPDLRCLESLWLVCFAWCGRFKSWPEGLFYLNNLKTLMIGGFWEELDYFPWPSIVAQHCLVSLEQLALIGWQKLQTLPELIQLMPALKRLTISDFDGMLLLPEWLGNLVSLQSLELWDCGILLSFPSREAMQQLTQLTFLEVNGCPLLQELCRTSTTEWSKIAHISTIVFDNVEIQSLD